MAERKPYLLRLPADVADAMQRWARDELRSLNAQIEFVLRDALRRRGRMPADGPRTGEGPPAATGGEPEDAADDG
ncbi:MAG: Arc family DNA-binding protein [Phycisphaerales bacterium]|nr:Arc family DNA-binding protein [Phycisphaerales bacterium]